MRLLLNLLFFAFLSNNSIFSTASESEDGDSVTSRTSIISYEVGVSVEVEGKQEENKSKREHVLSRSWTLMLLDQSRVDLETLDGSLKDPFWPFIIPKVREEYLEEKDKEEDPSFEFKKIEVEEDDCWICKLNLPDTGNPTEELVDTLMGHKAEHKADDVSKSEVPKRFSAALMFIPVEGGSGKFLVYLLGRWLSLLNVDSVARNFGLRTAMTTRIFCGEANKTNKNIRKLSAVESENVRMIDIMNARFRSRKGLYPLDSFSLTAGESRIEAIRFKPQDEWRRAHMTASHSSLQFRLSTLESSLWQSLRDRALLFFEIFSEATEDGIYSGFLPYIDVPVSTELSNTLTNYLTENWENHFPSDPEEEEVVYPHWTYWFRMRNLPNKYGLFNFRGRDDFNADETITIPGFGNVKVLNLIRTRPIPYAGKYYWFDRGEWFEISETTVKLMRSELERKDENLDYRMLEFPPYDEETIKKQKKPKSKKEEKDEEEEDSEEKGDYEEQAYNKMLVRHIKERFPQSEVSLMDRTDTYMSSKRDKFEFADIVFKDASGTYYLVHVKRAKSNQLGHVCTQAERSAMYLSGHLDRSALEYAFMSAELNMLEGVTFLGKRISFPWVEGITVAEIGGFKEDLKTKVLFPEDNTKRKSKEDEPPVYKVLRDFIEGKDFDAEFWRLHPHSLLKLFEKLSMLDLEEDNLMNRMKNAHDAAKEGIRKSLFFSEGTTLGTKKRSKIKIMIAVVDDGDSDFTLRGEGEEERTNRTVRLHQTRQVIHQRHFDFGWTVIPKKSAVLPRTLEEHFYEPEDLDTLLKARFPYNAINSGRFPEIELRPKAKDLLVRCYKSERGPQRLFVPPYHEGLRRGKASQGLNAQQYLAHAMKKAYEGGHIANSSEIYFPFEPIPKVWVLVKLVLPAGGSNEVHPIIIHGDYYDIKNLKDKTKIFIRAIGRLKAFKNIRDPEMTMRKETSKKKSSPKKKEKTKKPSPVEVTFVQDLPWNNMVDSGPAIFEHMVFLIEGDDAGDGIDYSGVRRAHFDLLQNQKKNFVKPFEKKNGKIVLEEGESFDLHPDSIFSGFRSGSVPASKPTRENNTKRALAGAGAPVPAASSPGGDDEGIRKAQEDAKKAYEKEVGYVGIKKDEVYKITGQRFLRVKMKGDGDCCFHALGMSREDLIGRMKGYIDEMEIEELDELQREEYETFTGVFTEDIWKKVGDNVLLNRINEYFRAFDVDPDNVAKCGTTEQQLTALKAVLGLNDNQIKYIRYRYEYKLATKERKKEIIEDFYGGEKDNNWFDPSAVIPIGWRFGFNAMLYQAVGGTLEERAKTDISVGVEELPPQRNLLYVNRNHYDLLHPFSLEEDEE